MQKDEHESAIGWGGIGVFLALTFVLAWMPALLLRHVWQGGAGPWITRLLAASALYAATMGWQPLLAALVARRWFERHDPLDAGVRPASARFALLGSLAPMALVLASVIVSWIAGLFGAPVPDSLRGGAEPELANVPPSLGLSLLLLLALVLTIFILYVQSFSEEYGWRGYFLSRLMRELGPRRGLLIHGAIWGLWYAPPFLLATDQLSSGALRCAAFIATCTLLGTLLGWLRLASRSIMPAVIANAVLTVTGGLPFILQNVDVGLRGTTYGPVGWLPLAALVALVLFGRGRAAVAVPELQRVAPTISVFSLLSGQSSSRNDLN